ncbi:protein very KIND-like [Orbicella faveolata]|uniref:protein very KIND-like n=1 Tax=Orbicella faveolata TaxID=48498 RepID=UPI0009E1EF3B|nr:protein very KIND-like [Orbicella faveolata]
MWILHHKHKHKTYYHAEGRKDKCRTGKFNCVNHFLFTLSQLILVDRSERGHYLMELITEKQKRDSNNNIWSDEPSDFVAVLQLEDPQGLNPVDGKKDSLIRKPMGSRKSKSPVQCFRRATPEKGMTYKPTLYLKALSVLDHSSRILAEQLTLIQQDLFFHIHPVHFLNSRAHGIGVGRSQSPSRERDSIFGFSTGSRRVSELPASSGEVPLPWEQNMYVSEPSTDGHLENLLEHAQDVSLWVAVEICSASSIKAQLALITKFVNAARYCCEIRNYSTCFQIVDALEMFVIRQLPVWKQVPTKTAEALEELKAVKVLLKTDSSWLMKSEASRDKPTIPCFLLFVIHVQQQELGGFTLPNDMFKWTKMRSAARLVDQIRLFKQMRYAFQTDDELKDRLKQRIHECKKENLHALASENASNFHLSSSHGSRKFHDAFKKMKATFGSHN